MADAYARYSFEIGSQPKGGFVVKFEELVLTGFNGQVRHRYRVEEGQVKHAVPQTVPPASADRLFLVVASGLPEFRPAYDALLSMGFYNLNPDQIREVQKPDAGELLRRDGSNLASVLSRLAEDRPGVN